MAYMFDLLCCAFSVIPYSRCSKASEIITHHLPILICILPLGIPMWSGWPSYEGMIPFFESFDPPNGHYCMGLLLRGNGLGFVSSLNEAIMCFQRAELSLNGQTTMFMLDKYPGPKYFTSRMMEIFELLYKMCIFCVFPVLSIYYVINTDFEYFDYIS